MADAPTCDLGTLLVANDLDKVYGEGDAATHALKEMSFQFCEGEFAAIIGQSGSGKSTLLNLLGLLDTPTSGSAIYHGTDTTKISKLERASLAHRAHRLRLPVPLPAARVHRLRERRDAGAHRRKMGPEEIRTRAEETLALLGIEGMGKKNANALSGGQKQRVAIARALMNKPSIVLADEPTGNLDTVNTNLVYDLFREINKETHTAFLIVTHDRSIAERTDRILEITDGVLVQDITTSDVVAES